MIKCLKLGCPALECLQQTVRQLYQQINGIILNGLRTAVPVLRTAVSSRPEISVAAGLFAVLILVTIISAYYPANQQKQAFQPIISAPGLPAVAESPAQMEVEVPRGIAMRKNVSAADLISQLKEENLWEITDQSKIPQVIFSELPENLHELEINIKKRAFLHTLLPVVMAALTEVAEERTELLRISQEIGTNFDNTYVHEVTRSLTSQEILFLQNLGNKYKAETLNELRDKVDIYPVSMILAQSAIESSWGTSRFARQGNNLFGVWTWGISGIIPKRRESGKSHKIAIYDSILDSVKAYILTLNRLPAYQELRELRKETRDSLTLAQGLRLYSERRYEYVNDVQRVISYNELQRYDRLQPAASQENEKSTILEFAENSHGTVHIWLD